jgi:hypothetical protein
MNRGRYATDAVVAATVAVTHVVGTGADGTTPSGAEYTKLRDDVDAVKVEIAALRVKLGV